MIQVCCGARDAIARSPWFDLHPRPGPIRLRRLPSHSLPALRSPSPSRADAVSPALKFAVAGAPFRPLFAEQSEAWFGQRKPQTRRAIRGSAPPAGGGREKSVCPGSLSERAERVWRRKLKSVWRSPGRFGAVAQPSEGTAAGRTERQSQTRPAAFRPSNSESDRFGR
jgi:hypothetical protein